RAAAAAAAG
ncbi:hypothetical protein CFC21_077442, partial [Triticum aestivum]